MQYMCIFILAFIKCERVWNRCRNFVQDNFVRDNFVRHLVLKESYLVRILTYKKNPKLKFIINIYIIEILNFLHKLCKFIYLVFSVFSGKYINL